jgi:hypothetical protein
MIFFDDRKQSVFAKPRTCKKNVFNSQMNHGDMFSGKTSKRLKLFRPFLAAAAFCMSAVAQQKVPPAKSGPPPVPVFDVKLTPDLNLSIALPDNMLVLWTQCDDVGNPYADVMTLAQPFRQTVAFTQKGVVMFATNQMTDIPEPQMGPTFVAGSAVYAVVTGVENAKKEEVTGNDEAGKEVTWTKTNGESRSYIARFDSDGSYRGALKLDTGFQPAQLAAFGSGDFAAVGVDESKTLRVGVMNSRGQLWEYLQLPKDITDRPKKSFDRIGSASVDVIAMFASFSSYHGNVLLVSSGDVAPIYEIRETGELRAVRVKAPNDHSN